MAVTVAVYAPVAGHEFVSIDDHVYVGDNPHVVGGLTWPAVVWAFTTSHANFWHPLTMLSLMLDVQLFGASPGRLHLTSLLLHLASTLLLFLALARMTGAVGRSAFVAALFAVHPLHVESVAWIAERKDVLSTAFWMLVLLTYIGYVRNPRWYRYGLTLVFFALGLMAKPMLVTLPFTLLLLDVWPLGRVALSADPAHPGRWPIVSPAWWPLLREKIPLFGLAAAASLVAFVAQQRGGAVATLEGFSLTARLTNALVAYVVYVAKMVWPHTLTVFYPYSLVPPVWPAIGALVVLASVSVLVVRLATRRPYLAVGWFWFAGTLLPVSGIVQVGSHAMADRYTYVPLIGLFVAVAWGMHEAVASSRVRRIALAATAVCIVGACAVGTRAQVGTWKDSFTLWQHALDVMPDNYYAHNALGIELDKQGRAEEAAAHFRRSSELAPGFPNPHNNLGLLLEAEGKTQDAVKQYTEALRRAPDYDAARINLANLLVKTGRAQEAMAHYNEALRRSPESPAARTGLGNALMSLGRFGDAITELREAVRLAPADSTAHFNLANVLAGTGQLDAAVSHYREALRVGAGSAAIHENLAITLAKLERGEEAIAEFTAALRLEPQSASVHNNFGSALLSLGRPAEAVAEFRAALRLEPRDPDSHMGLGSALFAVGRLEEALAEHQEAVRLAPGSGHAHYNLGLTLQQIGDLSGAAHHFTETLRLEGASAGVHTALAAVLEQLGRASEAALHYRGALNLKPDSATASAGLTRTLAAAHGRVR